MAEVDARSILELLPWALRRDTERYLTSIRQNAREIFISAEVPYTAERLEILLFLATIQKLWAMVNSQYWIVDRSLGLLEDATTAEVATAESEAAALQLGHSTYSRRSGGFRDLALIRRELEEVLRRLEIKDLIQRSSLVDLVRSLNREGRSDEPLHYRT